MHVAAADPDDCDFQQDVIIVFYDGLRHIDDFELL